MKHLLILIACMALFVASVNAQTCNPGDWHCKYQCWTVTLKRDDGTPIDPKEIAGIQINYRSGPNLQDKGSISVQGLTACAYLLTGTVVNATITDVEGRSSIGHVRSSGTVESAPGAPPESPTKQP